MKILKHPLIVLIIMGFVYWSISELLFYFVYLYIEAFNIITLSISTIILVSIFTTIMNKGFKGIYWYYSLVSLVSCPLLNIIILINFGSMTKILENDFSAGFIGLLILIYEEICLVLGVVTNLLIMHYKKRNY